MCIVLTSAMLMETSFSLTVIQPQVFTLHPVPGEVPTGCRLITGHELALFTQPHAPNPDGTIKHGPGSYIAVLFQFHDKQ